ncbi:MAG: radical SAM protein [Dehalococcoidia bacterium]|nr:radical SAM protein [Dehalococcoidia bacterium]
MSYYLPLTSGCSNNTCIFCYYYGSKLQMRDLQEVKEEIDALKLFKTKGVAVPGISPVVYQLASQWDGRRIFLQDGDALVYPFPRLLEALDYLNERFPDLERIAVYATSQDILRRSVDELRQLRERKLAILYIGLESGDDEILRNVGKNATSTEMIAAAQRVKESGMALSVMVILGLGGVELSERHALATARVLSQMDPEFGAALTLTVVPGTPLHQRVESGEFTLVNPFQSLQELRTIVANLDVTSCFFSSMHASNYLTIRGTLPDDRERILAQIDGVLRKRDPSMLRPEGYRGL